MSSCVKTWVKSSENIVLDGELIAQDCIRVECKENIYTRSFQDEKSLEYFLVETHVFRLKQNEIREYLLSADRICTIEEGVKKEKCLKENFLNKFYK